MLYMSVTLDTSHLDMSPMNLFAPGTTSRLNNRLMSVTADTSQDPIGPCGPLEQSGDSFRHSAMAAWSSALALRAPAAVGRYYSGYKVVVMVRVRMMVSISIRFRLGIPIMSKGPSLITLVRVTVSYTHTHAHMHILHMYGGIGIGIAK